ncbi:alpha/beta fold hydrolase [Pelagibaculum spongiae]|uniref:Alpha/beta hydrolase n=1 Tax=Pelagibaculum spongiae TaxID=2080658 RepID=A0A2V1GTF4_9GAMM|nr:alpha/beta hydrolase [Pelagibaculum spongiae]PVZ64975.1 alpha/beta hydrolase [Pelagibaculum spongiae]
MQKPTTSNTPQAMEVCHLSCPHPGGEHSLTYYVWGRGNSHHLICLHGLARNGRDFDDLAIKLIDQDYQVICPDLPGRGLSAHLPSDVSYSPEQYLSDMQYLLQHLKITSTDWIGSSLGGLIGMGIAAQPESPVQRLILNDIGPEIPEQAILRIGENQACLPPLDSYSSIAEWNYLRYPKSLGNLTPAQMDRLVKSDFIPLADDSLSPRVDPRIGESVRDRNGQSLDLWPWWQALKCSTLVIWGEDSDVLTLSILEKMQLLQPSMRVANLPSVDHTPSLMEAEQIELIANWLE